VQVTATEHEEMVEQGRNLFEFSERIVVKVPVNAEGLIAIKQLSREHIPVLGTAVFVPRQAFLASKAGAIYVAPYVSHMAAAGIDPVATLQIMKDILQHQAVHTKVMGAAIKNMDDVLKLAQIGIPAITVKGEIFHALIESHPLAEVMTKQLNHEWNLAFSDASIADVIV
jgi:TalC/MipB family fructose-6-phosphate aldolase